MPGSELQDGGQQLVLGKVLLERGIITADQLRDALSERARRVSTGEPITTSLGSILVSKGFLTDQQLVSLLAEQSAEQALDEPAIPLPSPEASIHVTPQGTVAGVTPSGVFPRSGATAPLTGADRLGKYSLVKELGRGGMGVVYEALDTELNRRCALKLMLSSPTADPKEVALEEERFVRESQLSAKLKHSNIVTVFEAGIIDGRRFLAMELIEGLPLGQWRQEGKVPLKHQVEVLRDVAMAVHHAHEQGILHRDLKPRNVLLGKNHQPYVTDFGLAKTLGRKVSDSLTHSGMVVGTPAYMSPEQAQGLDKIDWRTDIYSLGVMLYEILTGQTPFTGESPIEILMKVVKDPVPLPTKVAKPEVVVALDKTIENICLKALAKKDRDRYVTAKAFADDITKWLRGESVKVSAPKQKKGSVGRAVTLGVGGGLFVVASVAVGLLFYGGFGGGPTPGEYLDKAREARDEGRLEDAKMNYLMARRLDSLNAEAIAGLEEVRIEIMRAAHKREEQLRKEIRDGLMETERLRELARQRSADVEKARSEEERKQALAKRKAAEEKLRQKLEDVRKAGEELRNVQPKDGPEVVPILAGEQSWETAQDLLDKVVPSRDSVRGTWSIEDQNIVSDRSDRSRLEIPYAPPAEYDVRMRFTRKTGAGEVALLLADAGRPFALVLGVDKNRAAGFDSIAGAPAAMNPSTTRPVVRLLDNARMYTVLVQVRTGSVKAFLDDRDLTKWITDTTPLKLSDRWTLRDRPVLGIGSHGSNTIFHEVKILERSGKGRDVGPAERPELVGQRVNLGSLKPGLVSEYFYGTRFESLAVRKIASRLSFRWREGSPWLGGPRDFFSSRYSGYLHVPRSGTYSFSIKGDDGYRLMIDGVELVSKWKLRSPESGEVTCRLRGGLHEFVLEHFEFLDRAELSISWTDTGLNRMAEINERSLYHDPSKGAIFVAPRQPEFKTTLKGHSNEVTGLAFSPNGAILATASKDRTIRLWNLQTRSTVGTFPGHGSGTLAVAYSPDGKILASGGYDRMVRLWDIERRVESLSLEGHEEFVDAVAFSPDGALLASASHDRTIRLWDIGTGSEIRVLKGHAGGVSSLVFHPDGKRLYTGSVDHTIREWDVEGGKVLRTFRGHADWVEAVAIAPGGATLASASRDGTIMMWDLVEGKRKGAPLLGHTSEVWSLSFGRKGTVLVSGGDDSMLRLWDTRTGAPIKIFPGHEGGVKAVGFAPDGRTLASGSFDSTLRLWQVRAR